MVRWWWFGPAVVKPEILRELQQMKANGIGGAEMAFVYPEVLDDPVEGPEEPAVPLAGDAGRREVRAGSRAASSACASTSRSAPAGPTAARTITLDEAVTRLRTIEVPVPANATSSPAQRWKRASTSSPPRSCIRAPLPKAAAEGPSSRPRRCAAGPVDWDPASAQFLPTPAGGSERSHLRSPADTPRIALFFILSHTKQEVKRASVGAEGWVLDPFSHEAVAKHLKNVGEPLLSAFGSTPPYAIFSDSLEAYGADWTPNLPAEFIKRRGYDLIPHLPELVGGGSLAADTVRHDYGRTLTELIDENYLTQINDWAIAHHTKFRSQTYGEPAVSFSSRTSPACPRAKARSGARSPRCAGRPPRTMSSATTSLAARPSPGCTRRSSAPRRWT